MLTPAERDALPDHEFARPDSRSYPIPDEEHGRYALEDLHHEPPEVQRQIQRAVFERYPRLRPGH